MNNNSPQLKQQTPLIDRVDWSVRDTEILVQVKSAVEKLRTAKKPVKITMGKVAITLGLKASLEKHLNKLPQTKAYLESVTETVEDFQIRRIEWAIVQLNRNGEEIMEWKVLKIAGLRGNCSDQVTQRSPVSLLEKVAGSRGESNHSKREKEIFELCNRY